MDISTVCFVRKVEPTSVSKCNFRARKEDTMSWNSGISVNSYLVTTDLICKDSMS